MNAKQKAGRAGGLATLARHGREHMRKIGRRGAETTWLRYNLLPTGIGAYAMVDKITGKVVAVR